MAFRIQNNIAALNAQRNLGVSEAGMNKSLQRLSSGYRINSAADDAAGLSISTRFRANIASVKVAQRNISEANALLQVAEGAMAQIGDILTRMKELATQAASANAGTDLEKIDSEYTELYNEIDRIVNSTQYQGTKLLDGSFGVTKSVSGWDDAGDPPKKITDLDVSDAVEGNYTVSYCATSHNMTISFSGSGYNIDQTVELEAGGVANFDKLGISFTVNMSDTDLDSWSPTDTAFTVSGTGSSAAFQVGYDDQTSYSQLSVSLANLKASESEGLDLSGVSLATQTDAQTAIGTIDNAIDKLAEARGNVGAMMNRFAYAAANLDTTLENFTAADSVIRDADMAQEMTNFAKNQILVQAGVAMLSQANQAPQLILSLFR